MKSGSGINQELITAACDAQDQIPIDELEEYARRDRIVRQEQDYTISCDRCGLQKTIKQGATTSCANCGHCDMHAPWGKETRKFVKPCRYCGELPTVKVRGAKGAELYKLYCGNPDCLSIETRGERLSLLPTIMDWNRE